jgi:hypothetical protein
MTAEGTAWRGVDMNEDLGESDVALEDMSAVLEGGGAALPNMWMLLTSVLEAVVVSVLVEVKCVVLIAVSAWPSELAVVLVLVDGVGNDLVEIWSVLVSIMLLLIVSPLFAEVIVFGEPLLSAAVINELVVVVVVVEREVEGKSEVSTHEWSGPSKIMCVMADTWLTVLSAIENLNCQPGGRSVVYFTLVSFVRWPPSLEAAPDGSV